MGAPDPEAPLFLGFSVLRGGLRPWSRKGPDHGVGVDPETVNLRRGSSGKEKAHKHKQFCPVYRLGGRGSNVYVLCAEPKKNEYFRPGTRPGGLVTGVTEKLFCVPNLYVPFSPLGPNRTIFSHKNLACCFCPALQRSEKY